MRSNSDACRNLVLQMLAQPVSDTLWIVDENFALDVSLTVPAADSITAVTNRFDVCASLRQIGVTAILSDFDFSGLGKFRRIVYRISKEKMLTHHCINQALRHLENEGELILIGNKQDGIKSIVKNAAQVYGFKDNIKKTGSAYIANFPAPDAITDAQALPSNNYGELREVQHRGFNFYSKPGVFGWEKVDRGSELLISTLPTVHRYMKSVSSVLDLGCGWGYLMLATREWTVETRCATDNNIAAVEAAQKNFFYYDMDVTCLVDDCASEIHGRFDLILCNPPFHQGFAVSDSVTEKFLAAASRLSRRSTRAIFVVNQFIPLDKLAQKYFSQIRLLLQEDGFCVYELRG